MKGIEKIRGFRKGKRKAKKLSKLSIDEKVNKVLEKCPHLEKVRRELKYSKRTIIRYGKAIEKYPDLKDLLVKLATIAYDFREEQLKLYKTHLLSELANARCNVQIKMGFAPSLNISDDLPALSFDKECVVCGERKKGISICPFCLYCKENPFYRLWGNYWCECPRTIIM